MLYVVFDYELLVSAFMLRALFWQNLLSPFPNVSQLWNLLRASFKCTILYCTSAITYEKSLHCLTIKPTRCTNFSNLFWNTCFGQLLCPSSDVFHCSHSNDMSYRFVNSFRAGSGWICSSILIPLLCVQWGTPDDGQRNCPNHVEFHSKINLRN
jgi:hypothetical protein